MLRSGRRLHRLAACAGGTGVVGLLAALVIGFAPAGQCGAVFAPAVGGVAPACAAVLAVRAGVVWPLLVVGAVVLLAGVVVCALVDERHRLAVAADPGLAVHLEHLEALRDQGMLSAEEFAETRASIMRRAAR